MQIHEVEWRANEHVWKRQQDRENESGLLSLLLVCEYTLSVYACWIFNSFERCISVYFSDACCIASKMLFTDYTWNSVVKNICVTSTSINCVVRASIFFYVQSVKYTHKHTEHCDTKRRVCMLVSHDPLAVHICTDVYMRMHVCVLPFACSHTHTHTQAKTPLHANAMCVEVVRCCLYTNGWRPQTEIHGSDNEIT